MCCENFGRFHRRKLKKITNKAMKKEKKKTESKIAEEG